MPPLRTVFQNEISHNIEYGEALLTALRLRAQNQLEIVALHQHEDLVSLCRLMLDIQAVEQKICREIYRLSTCR